MRLLSQPDSSECGRCVAFAVRVAAVIGCAAASGVAQVNSSHVPVAGRSAATRQNTHGVSWPLRDAPRPPGVSPRQSRVVTDVGVVGQSRLFHLNLGDAVEHFGTVLNYRSEQIAPNDWNMTLSDQRVRLSFHRQNLVLADVLPALEETSSRSASRFPNPIRAVSAKPVISREARGIVVYLSSIIWLSDAEKRFLKRIRLDGWNVVAFSFPMDLVAEQEYFLGRDGERQFADRIDNHFADRAYAVESLLGYLAAVRPEFVQGPRVLIGGSAGAIAAPIVAARTGGFDAAVLVGGGANVARIMIESPVFDDQISLMQYTRRTGNQLSAVRVRDAHVRAQFASSSTSMSRLDPLRTGSALQQTPTLMLHAKFDRIVPAWTGDELHRSLGQPERWTYQVGHSALFVMLPLKAGAILKWLDETLARRDRRLAPLVGERGAAETPFQTSSLKRSR